MAIAMEEDYLGRSGDKLKRKLRFIVTGTDDDAAVRAHAEANVPSTHDGLVARNVSDIKQISDQRWSVVANYGGLSLFDIPEPASGTASYTFQAYVEQETFYYTEDRIATYPAGAPDLAGPYVGIDTTGDTAEHRGIVVPAGPVTDRLTYEYPSATIPASYRTTVRGLLGGSNAGTFLGDVAGTRRLVSCTASITSSGKQTIDFGFAYRAPKARTIGSHNLGTVSGWDSVWSMDKLVIKTAPGFPDLPAPEPIVVYVERFVPRVDFTTLGLPAV